MSEQDLSRKIECEYRTTSKCDHSGFKKNSLRTGANSKDVNINPQAQIWVKTGKLQIWHHSVQLNKTLT